MARVLIRAECVQLIEADLGHRSRGDPAADGVADRRDAAEHLDRLGEQPLYVQLVGDVGVGENRIDGRLRRPVVVDELTPTA